MKKSRWMVWSMVTGLAVVFVFSGCAGSKETMMTDTEMAELDSAEMALTDRGVVTEEIQPIQPKALQDLLFEYDRFDLSPEARAVLADNAAWLENNPSVKIQVQGHCDERGSNEYNIALGDRRAKSAYNYLVNLGVSAGRLSTISYGEEMPQCSQQTESCWRKNRRAHFSAK